MLTIVVEITLRVLSNNVTRTALATLFVVSRKTANESPVAGTTKSTDSTPAAFPSNTGSLKFTEFVLSKPTLALYVASSESTPATLKSNDAPATVAPSAREVGSSLKFKVIDVGKVVGAVDVPLPVASFAELAAPPETAAAPELAAAGPAVVRVGRLHGCTTPGVNGRTN